MRARSSVGLERHPLPVAAVADQSAYQDVLSQCINKKTLAQKTCKVSSSSKSGSWFDYTAKFSSAQKALMPVASAVFLTLPNTLTDSSDYARRLIHSSIEAAMVGLDSCQKACLIKCAASKVLTYAYDKKGKPFKFHKFSSTNELYCNRKGVCTEFSRIANDIGDNTSTKVQDALGGRHAYNLFEIDGQMYIGEPQNDRCEFYHTPATLNLYEKEYARQGRTYDGGWVQPFRIPPRGGRQKEIALPKLPAEQQH